MLDAVITDSSLKETYFVTPLTLELSRRTQSGPQGGNASAASSGYDKWKNAAGAQRAGPKGGGKSQGKGTRKGQLGDRHSAKPRKDRAMQWPPAVLSLVAAYLVVDRPVVGALCVCHELRSRRLLWATAQDRMCTTRQRQYIHDMYR